MILAELFHLAEREGFLDDAAYKYRPVDYLLRIAANGAFIGIEPTHRVIEGKNGKKHEKALDFRVPVPPRRTVQIAPAFLCDTVEYVLGAEAEGRKAERTAKYHSAFVEFVRQAAQSIESKELDAVLRFLTAPQEMERARAQLPQKGNAIATFASMDNPEALVSDAPEVDAWWSQTYSGSDDSNTAQQRCLVTGEWVVPTDKHPAIKRVPGGQAAGASIVSFNNNTFESYKLKGFHNAPIGARGAAGYVRALNRLLARQPVNPRYGQVGENKHLATRRHDLGKSSCVLYWARHADSFEDRFSPCLDANEESIGALFAAAEKGGPSTAETDNNRFFAIVLSGAQGRSILRQWIDIALPTAKQSLKRYFDDLRIVSNQSYTHALQMRQLLEATAVLGKLDRVHPHLEAGLLRAALQGKPFPRLLLQQLLMRLRSQSSDKKLGRLRWLQRAALLKAYLNRSRAPSIPEVTVQLDPTNTHSAYLLGRGFAILEKLQVDAVNPGQTIRDRFYGTASSSPAMVMPRLIRGAQPHISKAKNGHWLHRQLGEVLATVQVFPRTLNMEEQGLFALGYYHQNQALYSKRDKADESTSKRANNQEENQVDNDRGQA